MKKMITSGLAALILASGLTSAMAAPRAYTHSDQWFQPVHLENSAVPADRYFDEMARDGH